MWALFLMGIDKLKWVMRTIIYIPLVVTVIALVAFFVGSGSAAFDATYGAGIYAKINELAQSKGIAEAMMPMSQAIPGMLLSVLWAYSGAEAVSFVGSEVKSPRKGFMRGMIIGLLVVGVLYMVNAWAVQSSFGGDFIRNYSWLYYNFPDELGAVMGVAPSAPTIPFYAAMIFGSSAMSILLGFGYFFWYLNTAMVIWMGGIRGLFAMSFDRLIPPGLAAVSRRGVPTTANHLIGILAIIGTIIGVGDSLGASYSATILAIQDFTCLFFMWPLGLAAIFLPYTRPDLFEKSTFQAKIFGVPWLTIFGAITFAVGFWVMLTVGLELSAFWSQMGVALLILAGLLLAVYMYHKNRKEGIDPTKIFTEIPAA